MAIHFYIPQKTFVSIAFFMPGASIQNAKFDNIVWIWLMILAMDFSIPILNAMVLEYAPMFYADFRCCNNLDS